MESEYKNLYCKSCFDVLPELPENSVQLILCDPPYGVTANANDKKLEFAKLWPMLWRVAKPNAAIILFGQGIFSAELMMQQRKNYRYTLIWDKQLCTGHLNAKRRPLRRHEDILIFAKRQPVYHPQMKEGKRCHSVGCAMGKEKATGGRSNRNYRTNRAVQTVGNMKYPQSILSFAKPHSSVAIHPTEKPVELLKYLIRTYSDPGETILDFCMGSGSTGVAAIETGRRFVGVEINEAYFRQAEKRIAAAHYQPDVFELMEGVK